MIWKTQKKTQKRTQKDTTPGPTFTRFLDLPVELQWSIWGLAFGDITCVRINWPSLNITTSWPVHSIPQLGQGDPPGLIPYALPPGMPSTLELFPLPAGLLQGLREPDPNRNLYRGGSIDFDFYTYASMMLTPTSPRTRHRTDSAFLRPLLCAFRAIFTSRQGKGRLERDKASRFGPSTCLWVSRASRQLALRHAIVDTGKPLHPNTWFLDYETQSFRTANGCRIFGSVFKDQLNGRPCLVCMIPSASERWRKSPPRMRHDSYVAARLPEIERCIFGHRLSLTQLAEGMDHNRLYQLERTMFFQPQPHSPARRPEANHPWHCSPGLSVGIYFSVIHHLAAVREENYPDVSRCSKYYVRGNWYVDLIETGKCAFCKRPLIQELRANFPEMLDRNGCLDIVLLRDRHSIEEPERTLTYRVNEEPY
ncbi:hypothetical protein F4778DRAFT_760109 [Xylariomycetidae sp. FL2044]|nr:hypothetical protein F4778DRAFT_760109 [Xylariomycetidae sp. FL2044]